RCSALLIFLSPAPAPPQIYALSLHDALPILGAAITVAPPIPRAQIEQVAGSLLVSPDPVLRAQAIIMAARFAVTSLAASLEALRSEEHTSELQSRENLVCRLLLEKKKNTPNN